MTSWPGAMGCDVLVVGAGPAGSSAALQIARHGLRVKLIDRAAFPREKACGDGLMPGAVELLRREAIPLGGTCSREIAGVRMTMATQGSRECVFGDGSIRALSIRRSEFDHALVHAAVAAGAELHQNLRAIRVRLIDGRVIGAHLQARDGSCVDVLARWVIAADGSGSTLAASAGLRRNTATSYGMAARAYFQGITGLDDLFEVAVPLPGGRRRRPLAGYGWVFPLHGNAANVGVGLMPGAEPGSSVNLRSLFEEFCAQLRGRDSRFARMIRVSPLRGAPLNCGYDHTTVAMEGLLLVGDAAGLVDPFTGEGIQWALESGLLAAQVITDSHGCQLADAAAYRESLDARYRDRFRSGRRLLDTRQFSWRLLEETFGSDAPLFAQFRRAMFDFGFASALPNAAALAVEADLRQARLFLDRVHREIVDVLGHEFPLLRRVAHDWMADSARLLRAAVYWQAAQLGSAGIDDHVRGAACVELAHLGYLAFANVRCGPAPSEPAPLAVDELRTSARGRDRGGSCADAFAVMAGDFLLAKAYVLAARLGSSVCRLLAVASKEVCSREANTCMEAWTGVRSVDPERRFTGKDSRATFHVLACRVACEIADVPGELRATMSDYAVLFGAALSAARTTDRTPHLEAAQAVAAGVPDLDVRAEMMAAVRWLATRGADS